MTLLDLIVLALIAAAVLAILFGNRRRKKKAAVPAAAADAPAAPIEKAAHKNLPANGSHFRLPAGFFFDVNVHPKGFLFPAPALPYRRRRRWAPDPSEGESRFR